MANTRWWLLVGLLLCLPLAQARDDHSGSHAFLAVVAVSSLPAEASDTLQLIKQRNQLLALLGIIKKSWEIIARRCELEGKKIEKMLAEQLTGLGIKEEHITAAMRKINLETTKSVQWRDEEIFKLTDIVRTISKPIIIAFNKCDKAPEKLMEKRNELTKYIVTPTSAESELALSNAAEKGIIAYTPGSNDFSLLKKEEITEKQLKALDYI